MTRKSIFALAFAAAAAGTGCVPPKVLIANEVQTKYLLQEAASKQGGKKVFNFFVRLCDSEGERSTNCKDSMVLDNVVAESIY
jgi:cytochrome c5